MSSDAGRDGAWTDALRVVVVTDGRGEPTRIARLAHVVLDAGVRAVQIREPALGAAGLERLCERLLPEFEAADALLLVNDRADVVAAGLAHGVHLGHRSLSATRVRSFLPPGRLVGVSAHDPDEIEHARRAGADYVSLSPVFPPSSKTVPDTLGVDVALAWTRKAGLPVLWLGGITAERVLSLPESLPAAGFAVLGAVSLAPDPHLAAAGIVAAARRHRLGEP